MTDTARPEPRVVDNGPVTDSRPVLTWLTDMDGVLVHEEDPIPGAKEFIAALREAGIPFLVLTNNSIFTPRDLRQRLLRSSGIDVPEESIWTSALATAQFLDDQRPGGSAYVVGETGLTAAVHDIGYVMTDQDPDYVVLGETRTYSFEAITRAIRLINNGARFIATNPDPSGPSPQGMLPATGSVAALISTATGRTPYFIGKPNPLMMRSALNRLEAHSETTVMIGDRMDTDIISGLEAGLRTILVATGATAPGDVQNFPYRPTRMVDSIADVVPLVSELFRPDEVRRLGGPAGPQPAHEAPQRALARAERLQREQVGQALALRHQPDGVVLVGLRQGLGRRDVVTADRGIDLAGVVVVQLVELVDQTHGSLLGLGPLRPV